MLNLIGSGRYFPRCQGRMVKAAPAFLKHNTMYKVLETETLVVHDDREPISLETAMQLLLSGNSICMASPPDYSAENDMDVYDPGYRVYLHQLVPTNKMHTMPTEEALAEIQKHLIGYDLYK